MVLWRIEGGDLSSWRYGSLRRVGARTMILILSLILRRGAEYGYWVVSSRVERDSIFSQCLRDKFFFDFLFRVSSSRQRFKDFHRAAPVTSYLGTLPRIYGRGEIREVYPR